MWRKILFVYFEIPFTLTMLSPQFGACNDFFDHNFLPRGYDMTVPSNIAELCQNENGYRKDNMFATLYDKVHKIPVYTAYVLDKSNPKCPLTKKWHVESDLPKTKQSLGDVYKNTGYVRGYLGLNCYPTEEGKESVFALTNTIPEAMNIQHRGFNRAQEKSKQIMDDDCIDGVSYYISGVIPGGKTTINSDVNVPSFLYTAACCRQQMNGGPFSFGFISENKRDALVNLLDVVKLGKAIKDNYLIPLKEPIKFFMDDCNNKDESSLKKLKKMVNEK